MCSDDRAWIRLTGTKIDPLLRQIPAVVEYFPIGSVIVAKIETELTDCGSLYSTNEYSFLESCQRMVVNKVEGVAKNNSFARFSMNFGLLIIAVFLLPVLISVARHTLSDNQQKSWWELRRDSSLQAPAPAEYTDAVIQVYAARAARWRGAFGVHTWIAVKPRGADDYTRIEVMGYALRWSGSTVRIRQGSPDGYWFGSKPWLLRDIRGGADVDEMIDRLISAAENYPYDKQYRVWPGPNSNTFIATLARQVPELRLELPPTAVGKDYLPNGQIFADAPSDSGVQLSVRGLLGLMIAAEEGVEMNLLGLTAGVDFSPLAIKLPGMGRIGNNDYQSREID